MSRKPLVVIGILFVLLVAAIVTAHLRVLVLSSQVASLRSEVASLRQEVASGSRPPLPVVAAPLPRGEPPRGDAQLPSRPGWPPRGGAPEPPGRPAATLSEFPETSMSAEGGAVTVSGRVDGGGYDGPVGVLASVRECLVGPGMPIPVVASTRLDEPGAFELRVPAVFGQVHVCAFALADTAGAPAGDPFGITLHAHVGPLAFATSSAEAGTLRLARGHEVSLGFLFGAARPRP